MQLAKAENDSERRVVGTLLAASDDLDLNVLGTAFVVGAAGQLALCMCAAHSLERALALESARRHASAWTIPPDAMGAPRYASFERVHVVFLVDREVVTCRVRDFSYIGGNDLALLTVEAPEGRSMFSERLALDLAVPRIGDEVAVLTNHIELEQGDSNLGSFSLELQMRHGVVTEVNFGRTMPGQSGVFYTSIPAHGGMSGSPVLRPPKLGEPLTVCGVLSSDLSPAEAFNDFLVSGRSAMSMLWPAHALGITARHENGSQHFSFGELLAAKFLDDHTVDATVVAVQRRDQTIIVYKDSVYGGVELKVTGHPNAPE